MYPSNFKEERQYLIERISSPMFLGIPMVDGKCYLTDDLILIHSPVLKTGGIPFNEYNFGPNVPNPKSMWNTLDFEEGAGPLAYTRKKEKDNSIT